MGFVNVEGAKRAGETVDWSFGENWQKFVASLTDARVQQARDSLQATFGDLQGLTFADIGCGSGLFSLAAHLEGATVMSVDVDPSSVACAQRLAEGRWTVRQGSILDGGFIADLGQFDVVYSWGVLHHTGAMWEAVDNTLSLVRPDGRALIALYNRPRLPKVHIALKRIYNRLPKPLRPAMRGLYGSAWVASATVKRRVTPAAFVRDYGERSRGMSYWRDVEDWLGGLPFEYTEPDEFTMHIPDGFRLERVNRQTPGGNHEYLLAR